ncbi:MAG: hypothetical protein ACSHX0_13490 [Akkermansiaceae bacterium]
MLGDTVKVKRLFKRLKGIVAYVPGISIEREDTKVEGQEDWLIRLDRGDFLSTPYLPSHPRAQPNKNISFICRGDEGILKPDESLSEDP